MKTGNYVIVDANSSALFDQSATGIRPTLSRVARTVVVDVKTSPNFGMYAPLTSSGNIVVDDILASCYATFANHRLAHSAMTPLIVGRRLADFAEQFLFPVSLSLLDSCDGQRSTDHECTHWYARVLRTLTEFVLPRGGSWWYDA